MAEEKKFTQEELNEQIKERLARANEKHEKEIKAKDDEIGKLNKQIEELNSSKATVDEVKAESEKEINSLKSQLKEYETASVKRKVADELGLKSKAVEYIQGETEEEMRKSAEGLKELTGAFVPPLATQETNEKVNNIDDALALMNEQLKGD